MLDESRSAARSRLDARADDRRSAPAGRAGDREIRAMARVVEPLPLEAVLVTDRLATRPPRAPDHAAENRALHALASALGQSARTALDALMREAVRLCRPDGNATAGVSLLERDPADGPELFRWTAIAGRLSHAVGGSTPRDFSPCGVCVDQERPVLFMRPDLRYTYFLDTGLPFEEGLVLPFRVNGRIAGTIWIVTHDDRRLLDAEDVRIMSSLADFTGAVYAQLAARAVADEARADREQLLQTVSHEWRTPLGIVTGMTALVADGVAGPVTPEQRTLLDRARAATDHLLALVADTVARSRPGADASVSHVERLDVCRLVAETAAMVEPSAVAAGVAFEARIPATAVPVHADAMKVRQVLLNLLANAVKFAPGGAVSVHVVPPPDDRTSDARVVVRDTGIGIAPEDMDRLFQPFTQLDQGLTRRHGGTGLGLHIAHRLAVMLGGGLEVSSAPGEGSVFTLILGT